MRGLWLGILILTSPAFAKEPPLSCVPYNFKYEFCYEEWLPKEGALKYAKIFERTKFASNVALKSYMDRKVRVFAFEFRNDEYLNLLANLPSEEYEDEFLLKIITPYTNILSIASSLFQKNVIFHSAKGKNLDSAQSKALVEELYKTNPDLKSIADGNVSLRMNFATANGRLMKSFDLEQLLSRLESSNVKGMVDEDQAQE